MVIYQVESVFKKKSILGQKKEEDSSPQIGESLTNGNLGRLNRNHGNHGEFSEV